MRRFRFRRHSLLPGFGPALGYTLLYLGLLVLLPLGGAVLKAAGLSWADFWRLVSGPRAAAAFRLSFLAAFGAALINAVFGFIAAWVLVRYTFPGRRFIDALVDLPFALPTSVAGIALTALFSRNGWIGALLEPLGIRVAFTPLGVLVALVFIGLPFTIRTVQPVIADLDREAELAAASLGASAWQTFRRITLPAVLPAVLTGFALAFARGIGEYGPVIFISGNPPLRTEIVPLLIVTRLEQYDYAGATALAVAMLALSFVMLLTINSLQAWSRRRR